MTEERTKEILSNELIAWQKRLAGIIDKIDMLPSSKKRRLSQYLRDFDILFAELEDRINLLNDTESLFYDINEDEAKINLDHFRNMYNESQGIHMDYDYSG